MRRGAIAVCVVALLAGTAAADRADALFRQGKKLLAEKRYADACEAFEGSDRLDPGIGAKLNVARCYQEWGRLATAWRWFSDAERMARTTKDERAPKIHALIEELDGNVPRLTVKAAPDADLAELEIKLDRVPLPMAELGVERRVDPGPHQIDYVVRGEKRSKTVPVERGGSSEVLLDLPAKRTTAPPVSSVPTGSPVRAPVRSAGNPGHTRRILGLGVAAAGVVTVGIAGLVTLGARGDYRDALADHCRGAVDMCDAEGLSATHHARDTADTATVVTIIGGVAVIGGLALYIFAPRAPRAPRNEHAFYVAPSLSPDGGAVVAGGRF